MEVTMQELEAAETQPTGETAKTLSEVVERMRAEGLDVLDHCSVTYGPICEVSVVLKAGTYPHDHVLILVGRGPTEPFAIRSLRQDVAAIQMATDVLRRHLPY